MKKNVTKRPILSLPYFGKIFQVDYDVSGFAIGTVLSREGQPISFFSENLGDEKHKYSVHNPTFYAIV